MMSVSIGVCTDSADIQIPVSGARASEDREVMCATGSPPPSRLSGG
jgi:hypothetical protein